MTSRAAKPSGGQPSNLATPEALRRLKRRYREEARFRGYGVAAIVFAIAALVVLLISIVGEAVSAFTRHEIAIDAMIDPALVDPSGTRDPARLAGNVSAFSDVIRVELGKHFPEAEADRASHRQLNRLVSTLAGQDLAETIAKNPALVGQRITAKAPVSDIIDLYLKGLITKERIVVGPVAADVSRGPDGVRVRATGGFTEVHADMVQRLRDEAALKQAGADISQAAIGRTEDVLKALQTRRDEIAAAAPPALREAADVYAVEGGDDQVALAKLAGGALADGETRDLNAKLQAMIAAERVRAESEAGDLMGKGAGYARKAAAALKAGEPTAETRRIQAETAYLAADRRRVDALLLAEKVNLPLATTDAAMAEASLLLGQPLAPLAQLAEAAPDARAVAAINAFEVRAAEAAVTDQARRIALLEAEVATLRPVSADRSKALEEKAVPAAKSRLARLTRDLEARQAAGARLAQIISGVGPAPLPEPVPAPTVQLAPPAAPAPPIAATPASPDFAAPTPADPGIAALSDADFVAAEREAQLGLDFGGPLAMAMALGAADKGQGEAALKALVIGHVDQDIAETLKDVERLTRKRDRDADAAKAILAPADAAGGPITPDEFSPSLLVEINGGVVKAARVTPDAIEGVELIPLKSQGQAAPGAWRVRELKVAEADRLVSDRQAAWANALKAGGEIRRVPSWALLTNADSTYPELAGLAAGLAGTFWIMIVTLSLSLPVGVMAAIYLEEFAPRNRLTDFIEVNINNLAAVPSIVFGLLGAAVFINFFDLPRSAPLVGGLVLSLITLPTIIIATRAALGAVPPSIREGALAVGASLPQTVFHHVLPLAAPGIMTGAIIGLARALGETAPLLLIGMVAFVADPPATMFDSATALPVLVYKWSSAAERAWQPMTSAAIIVLLLFMFAMNALAVYLRRRLERRW